MSGQKNYKNLAISKHLEITLEQLGTVIIFDKNLGKTSKKAKKGGRKYKKAPPDLEEPY